MHEKLGTILGAIGVMIAGAAAVGLAGTWSYYIWSFDWGHFGTRGWGLWGMVMMFGAILIFAVVWLFFFWLLSLVDEGRRY